MNNIKKNWLTPTLKAINGGGDIQSGAAYFSGPEGYGPCTTTSQVATAFVTTIPPACGTQTMGSVTGGTYVNVTQVTLTLPSLIFGSGSGYPNPGPFTDCSISVIGTMNSGTSPANIMVNCS